MEFQHPELRKYYENIQRLMGSTDVDGHCESNSIFQLMAMVDRFKIAEWDAGGSLPELDNDNWSPKSPELTEVIQHILAPEQRVRLRAWFKATAELNPTASAFRDWLGARIGESLKPESLDTMSTGVRPL